MALLFVKSAIRSCIIKIKIDPLDRLFSQYIKARDKCCQRCGGSGGLQTSHFWGRGRKSVRWDSENSCLLCYGCHQYFHANPAEHTEWFIQRLGQERFNLLSARTRILARYIDKEAIRIYLENEIKKLEGV